MSRLLKLDNIGALMLQGDTYGWHDFELRYGDAYARSTSALRLLTPGRGDVSGLTLVVDGPVYIEGAAVLTDYDTFTEGGYLGSVEGHTLVRYGTMDGATGAFATERVSSVSYTYLGIVPGPYTGGLRISGLAVPRAGVWEDVPNASGSLGYRKRNRAQAFVLNNRRYYIWNHQVDYYDKAGEDHWFWQKNIYPGMICTGFSAGHA